MTEEKKDDLNEQQSFLDGHEELLKTINNKAEAASETKPAKPEETPAEESAFSIDDLPLPNKSDETVVEEETAPEKEESPALRELPALKELPALEELPTEEGKEAPVVEEEPVPAEEPKAAGEKPAPKPQPPARKSKPKSSGSKKKKKKKKPQHPHHHTERDDAAAQRHEELLKQQQLEQQEVKEVLVFVQKYAKPVVIGILVICALVLANGFFKSQRLKKEARADSALLHAQGTADLQAIVDDYASTPTAPLAQMMLAREKFNEGSFDEAESLYLQFTKKHASHELALQAQLNLIACKESKGQKEEAQRLYGEFAKKHEGSYLVPPAMIGQARCLEALGQFDKAQTVYEDIIGDFPDSAWSQTAEMNLDILKAKQD